MLSLLLLPLSYTRVHDADCSKNLPSTVYMLHSEFQDKGKFMT